MKVASQTHHDVRARNRRGNRSIRKVGFFGCNDRVVRVELAQMPERRYPQVIRLQCPACTHEHEASPMWREWKASLDEGKEATIVEVAVE